MANNFDRALINGKNVAANTLHAVYFCPTSTTTKTVGIGLIFSNVSTSQILVDLAINGVETMLDIPVPAGSSFEYHGGNKIVLKSGDVLRARCDTANALNVYMSYMEIT